MAERHWGHTVRWVETAPAEPTHTVTATFGDGRSRDAEMIALMAKCANDPACVGEPSCFTTAKAPGTVNGLVVTLYWGGGDA